MMRMLSYRSAFAWNHAPIIRRIYGCLIITVKAAINLVEMPLGYCLLCLYGQIIESDACADAGVYGSPETLLDLCLSGKV